MSLDVDLIAQVPVKKYGKHETGVFVRENGKTRELAPKEIREKFPDATWLEKYDYENNTVFSANITHNLGDMADEAGIYEAVWRPHRLHTEYDISEGDRQSEWEFEDNVIMRAKDIIPILDKGLSKMNADPGHYKQFNPPNGWGDYETFVDWVADYLSACKKNPEAIINTDR